MRILLPIALLISACVTGVSAEPDAATIARQFEAVGPADEFVLSGPTGIIRKLDKPVRYIISHPNSAMAETTRRHMSRLAAITGLDVSEVRFVDQANFRVVYGERKQFLPWLIAVNGDNAATRALAQNACFATVEDHGTGVIDYASAVIGTDNSTSIRNHCHLEEIVQALGPGGDACIIRHSLFCDGPGTYDTGLTEADEIILRTLYDPRLTPGMTAAEAMPIARRVIAELVGK